MDNCDPRDSFEQDRPSQDRLSQDRLGNDPVDDRRTQPTAPPGFLRVTVLYAVLIACIILAADLGRLPVRRALALVPYFDKLGHFLLIGTLAFLVNTALGARCFRTGGGRWLVGSFWLSLVVVLEELSQIWLPGRAFEWQDLGADFAGILFFGWLSRVYVRHHRKSSIPSSEPITEIIAET